MRLVGALVQPGLRPVLLDHAAAQDRGRGAVEGGGLVQAHERIGLEPVAADAMAPVDERDAYVGMVDERVREAHPVAPAPTTR